jgi:hypothetical protein
MMWFAVGAGVVAMWFGLGLYSAQALMGNALPASSRRDRAREHLRRTQLASPRVAR